jgi:hypothetical protein
MASLSPLFVLPPPGSSETREEFSTRAIEGKLTNDDFKHFSAWLYLGKPPHALEDLLPTAVEPVEVVSGPDGTCLLYSFSDDDAATIRARWYSSEEKGMYSIENHCSTILNETERSYRARCAIFEQMRHSKEDADKALENYVETKRRLNTQNAGVDHSWTKPWISLPMVALAFWWISM